PVPAAVAPSQSSGMTSLIAESTVPYSSAPTPAMAVWNTRALSIQSWLVAGGLPPAGPVPSDLRPRRGFNGSREGFQGGSRRVDREEMLLSPVLTLAGKEGGGGF